MTIIEKMYAGEKLSEAELKAIVWGGYKYCNTPLGDYEFVDEVEGDRGRWTQRMKSVVRVGDDLWCVPWEAGLTEEQENMYYKQPYRVQRKERVVTEVYYEPIEG